MLFVTLVGQYPFERPEDKGDPQKMHRMIRRIVSVDYKLPSRVEVSADCKARSHDCSIYRSRIRTQN
jgi:serine/threonine-protein kinase SRK2